MTSSSSGDFPLSFLTSETFCMTESFFQPATTPSQRELICHHFHHTGIDTSFSTLTSRIGFSDASFPIARTIKPQPIRTQNFPTCLPLDLLFLSWVLGSHPWLFSSRVLGSRPWLCFFLHVHLARVSSNLLLTPWLTAYRVSVSCSKHAQQNASFALLRAPRY